MKETPLLPLVFKEENFEQVTNVKKFPATNNTALTGILSEKDQCYCMSKWSLLTVKWCVLDEFQGNSVRPQYKATPTFLAANT
jgi:hypothetical protein